ncbi:MAG: hypothetical protein M1812_005773 [Candelaria pacifica]|nr:MAG: hypothetical protein M1812_005773 [Candelaria pacifica]
MTRSKKTRSGPSMRTGEAPDLCTEGLFCFIDGTRFLLPKSVRGVRGISNAGLPSFSKQFLIDNEDHDIQKMSSAVLREAFKAYIILTFPDDTVADREAVIARRFSGTAMTFLHQHDMNLARLRGITAVGSLVEMSPRPELESPHGELSFDEQERRSESGDLPGDGIDFTTKEAFDAAEEARRLQEQKLNKRASSPSTIAPAMCSSYSYVLRNDHLTTTVRKASPNGSSADDDDTTKMGTGTSKELTKTAPDEHNAITERPNYLHSNPVVAESGILINEHNHDFNPNGSADQLSMLQPERVTTDQSYFKKLGKTSMLHEPETAYKPRIIGQAPTASQPNLDTTNRNHAHEPAKPDTLDKSVQENDGAVQDKNGNVGDGNYYNYYGPGRDASTSVYGQNRDVFSSLLDSLDAFDA